MTKPIISVENLSKKYQISHQGNGAGSYTALRDVITDAFVNIGKKLKPPAQEDFWALKDVSFEVNQGDRLGIIGRNGAGKSTLLKILSRITEPTKGKVTIRGRVASLLEVGTGFHPELSGRENIYLNGAILGMTRAEIKRKFDEIVDFAETEKFLDTPVKRYSSGMYVRLAFAVAAHLEPEILLIDEVLAVGDLAFQKKCLGKMEDVSKHEGRTILFVSHNTNAVSRLCNKCILIDKGQLIRHDATNKVTDLYCNSGAHKNTTLWTNNKRSFKEKDAICVNRISIENDGIFDVTDDVVIKIEYSIEGDNVILTHGLEIKNQEGVVVLNSHDLSDINKKKREPGLYSALVTIPANFMSEGYYYATIGLFRPSPLIIYDTVKEAISFTVDDGFKENSSRGEYIGPFPGIVRPKLKWESTYVK